MQSCMPLTHQQEKLALKKGKKKHLKLSDSAGLTWPGSQEMFFPRIKCKQTWIHQFTKPD